MCEYDISTPLRKTLYISPRLFYLFTFVLVAFLYANVRNNIYAFDQPDAIILENIFTNIHTNPIKDIQVVAATASCPDSYETVTLGTWGGIANGCLCSSATYYGRQCTSSDIGCVSVSAISSIDMSVWTAKKFCIQRITYYTFLNLTGKCDTGSTQCASGYCAYYNESCPITDVKFIDTSATVPANYASVTFNSTTNLIFTNTTAAQPIVNLEASLYNAPCLDPYITAFSSAQSPYPLSVYPENGCLQGGLEANVLAITQTPVPTLFSDNGIATAIAKLDGYVSYNKLETAYLMGVRQYALTSNSTRCQPADPSIFADLRYQEERFRSSTTGLLISAIVANIGMFFLFIVEVIIRNINHPKRRIRLIALTIVIYLALLLICVVYIIIGAFGARCKVDVEHNLRYLKYLGNNQCFQQAVVNTIVQGYQSTISYFYSIVWVSIGLLIVACSGIILAIALTVIECLASAGRSDDYQAAPQRAKTNLAKSNISMTTSQPLKGNKSMTASQMKGSHKKPIENSSIELLLK